MSAVRSRRWLKPGPATLPELEIGPAIVTQVAAIVTLAIFILAYFFGIPVFNVPRFLAAKFSGKRRPELQDDIRPEYTKREQVQQSRYLRYSVSEVVVLGIENQPTLKQNMYEAVCLFGPSVLAVILTFLPIPAIISSASLLITMFWMAFLFFHLIPIASVRTPTKIIFTGDAVEIHSPIEINDELKSRIELDRKRIGLEQA